MNPPAPLPHLPWLQPGDCFPPVAQAWTDDTPAPGLLAAGGTLDCPTLCAAYQRGIFPWFSEGQPTLWWCPHPRMVLHTDAFKLHASLRKQIRSLLKSGRLEIRMDHDFKTIMQACAQVPRAGQKGTWIGPDMLNAYANLHAAGHAHSVETWIDGQLAAGLYVVNMGHMVFGESMFARVSNASKIALAALVSFCRKHHLPLIDCQQQTAHLASLGALPIARPAFSAAIAALVTLQAPSWHFSNTDWNHTLG